MKRDDLDVFLSIFTALAFCWTASALAQSSYPTKSIRLIVPVAPAGATDFTARLIAQKTGELLGQSIIIDNRPGASGNIGAEIAARANPDGYTLVMPVTSFSINPSLYSNLPFDTVRDFTPVVLATSAPLLLVINPSVRAMSVSELVALVKSKPGELNYAHNGKGTTAHIAGELFKKLAGANIVDIVYKGGGPSIVDLIAGRVQIYFSTIPAAIAHVNSRKLRALAVTTQSRFITLPDIPTISESGIPGFDVAGWFGIFAPAGTPKSVVHRLNKDINAVLIIPDTREQLAKQGLIPGGGTPEQLNALLHSELKRWSALIKEIGLMPN
jgi:tripartite-type tricarboxylate transporter receptor subunit TctC